MTGLPPAMLRAILETPEDDGIRLILADWLDENGQAERAAFIREAVRYPHASFARLTASDDPFPLLGLTPGEPVDVNRGGQVPEMRTWVWGETDDFACVIHDLARGLDYREDRGFVSGVRCKLADFMAHAATLFNAAPITHVRVIDREPTGPIVGGTERGRWFWLRRDFPPALWPLVQADADNRVTSNTLATCDAAQAALSLALVSFGRQAARRAREDVS